MTDGDDEPFLDPAALARAEAALDNLAADYLRWLDADLNRAQDCLAAPGDDQRLFAILHDIKGQAATFGYPLVSAIAHRLCRDIQGGKGASRRLEHGLALIRQAMAEGEADDSGEAGRRMLATLD